MGRGYMKRIFSSGFFLLLILAGLSVSDVARSARNYNKTVQVIAGKADTVELSGAVADVLVANPAIADVGTLRSNRLYIVGKTVGDTNVLAYDENGNQLANITIQVRADDKNLQDTLREFFPDEKITARTIKNNIVLSGNVSSAAVSNQVRDLAAHFLADKTQMVDLMKVRGEQQVMLKVKVLEVDKNVMKELGVTTAFKSGDLAATRGTGPWAEPVPLGGLISGQQPFGMGSLILGPKFAMFQTALQGLETQGLVNTLAEPNLTAISGETAGFLAGGEFPIPGSKDAQGNIVIDYKQFGVSLNFTPTVMSKERIALHLSAEVSDRDTADGVTLNGLTVPALTVRRAETTVELGSGNTIMIAGLLKSSTLHSIDGLPGAQDLPIIGQLFKSKSFSRNESELLFIITPYLVDSYAQPDAVAEKDIPLSPPGSPIMPIEKTAPVEKVEAIPEKAADVHPMTAMAVPAPASDTVATLPSLSRTYMDNLRKVYGDRALEKVGSGTGFGYIVE